MNRDSAQALHDAVDGRPPIRPLPEDARRLVWLARECQRIQVAGPGPAALARIEARFSGYTLVPGGARTPSWIRAWTLRGQASRLLAHRFAAAGLVASVIGFGGAATAGVDPMDIARGVARLGISIAVNLTPVNPDDTRTATTEFESAPWSPQPAPTPPADVADDAASVNDLPIAPGGDALQGEPAITANEPVTIERDPGASPPPAPTGESSAAPARTTSQPTATPTATPAVNPSPEDGAGSEPRSDDAVAMPHDETATPTAAPIGTGAPTPAATPAPTVESGGGWNTVTYTAGQAGSVVLRYSSTSLELVVVTAAPGWTWNTEDVSPGHIKVSFIRDDSEVTFEATLVRGELVSRVEESDEQVGNDLSEPSDDADGETHD